MRSDIRKCSIARFLCFSLDKSYVISLMLFALCIVLLIFEFAVTVRTEGCAYVFIDNRINQQYAALKLQLKHTRTHTHVRARSHYQY